MKSAIKHELICLNLYLHDYNLNPSWTQSFPFDCLGSLLVAICPSITPHHVKYAQHPPTSLTNTTKELVLCNSHAWSVISYSCINIKYINKTTDRSRHYWSFSNLLRGFSGWRVGAKGVGGKDEGVRSSREPPSLVLPLLPLSSLSCVLPSFCPRSWVFSAFSPYLPLAVQPELNKLQPPPPHVCPRSLASCSSSF